MISYLNLIQHTVHSKADNPATLTDSNVKSNLGESTMSNVIATLLTVKEFEDDRLIAKVVAKTDPNLKVSDICYEACDNSDFTGTIFTFHKQPCDPVKFTIPRGNSGSTYVRAKITYTIGNSSNGYSTYAETETRCLSNRIVHSVEDYLTPTKVLYDKNNRPYTIFIAKHICAYANQVTWSEAMEYIQHRNTVDTNWSLPNQEEAVFLKDLYSLRLDSMKEGQYWLEESDETNPNYGKVVQFGEYASIITKGKQGKAFLRPIIRCYLDNIQEPTKETEEQLPMQGTPCEDYYECEDSVKEYFESLEDHGPIVIEELFRIAAMLSEKEDVTFIDKLAAENLHALAMVLDEGYSIIPKIDIK